MGISGNIAVFRREEFNLEISVIGNRIANSYITISFPFSIPIRIPEIRTPPLLIIVIQRTREANPEPIILGVARCLAARRRLIFRI